MPSSMRSGKAGGPAVEGGGVIGVIARSPGGCGGLVSVGLCCALPHAWPDRRAAWHAPQLPAPPALGPGFVGPAPRVSGRGRRSCRVGTRAGGGLQLGRGHGTGNSTFPASCEGGRDARRRPTHSGNSQALARGPARGSGEVHVPAATGGRGPSRRGRGGCGAGLRDPARTPARPAARRHRGRRAASPRL